MNKGRVQVSGRPFSIGQNPQVAALSCSKRSKKSWTADLLAPLFMRARISTMPSGIMLTAKAIVLLAQASGPIDTKIKLDTRKSMRTPTTTTAVQDSMLHLMSRARGSVQILLVPTAELLNFKEEHQGTAGLPLDRQRLSLAGTLPKGLDLEDRDGKPTQEAHQYPANGVFPEKVNQGRVQVNGRPVSVGQNLQPAAPSRSKTDAFATLIVKARINAFNDAENLFQIPQPDENFRNWFSDEDIGSVTNGKAS